MSAPPGKPKTRILRMGHVLAFHTFLDHVGAPVGKFFRRHGLPTLCDDPNAFVPLERAWGFFDTAAKSVEPALGWHVGRFIGDQHLNRALLNKLEHEPTLHEALRELIRLSASEASHVRLGFLDRSDDVLFFTRYPDMRGMPGYASSQSYQLGLILDLIRHFCGDQWIPEEIGIEALEVPAVVEEMLPGCRILPRQPFGYVAIPRSCLPLPAPKHQADGNEAGLLPLKNELDYPEMLRLLLTPYLPEGYPDASLAASLVDTSVRTLERRLSDSGTTYRKVIDGLRFDKARNLLAQTNEPIIDVAAAVGFEDPANFSRMFRRIGGLSPRQFRGELREHN